MKANPAKHKRINVITLGCSKNIWDSEMLISQLGTNKLKAVHQDKVKSSDTVVINTCGFIESAKQESINTILDFAEAKKNGDITNLVVMGCLSERYSDELKTEIPEVDAFFGSNKISEIVNYFEANYKHELLGERQLTTPSHYAYFKISEGCNRPCSFCAIPLMRGKHVSFSIKSLKRQAEHLAQKGVKELILIAQDLSSYGIDLYGKRNLPELLENLSGVNDIEWVRLQYAFPSQFPLETLDLMKNKGNICNYLDMPLQHISDNLLKIMRRGITKRRTYELLDQIRQKVPEINLRTTIMVGHPGETDQDHEELLQFIEDIEFDRLGVFTYSHEENTHSFQLKDNIPEELKSTRAAQVMELQRGISLKKNHQKIGAIMKVLIDGNEGEYYIARTEADSPEVDNEVLVKSERDLETGNFYTVEITDAMEYDLFGKVIE